MREKAFFHNLTHTSAKKTIGSSGQSYHTGVSSDEEVLIKIFGSRRDPDPKSGGGLWTRTAFTSTFL